MNDLFVDMLKDVYDAENQILKALPKMVEKASSENLKNAFNTHLKQTEKQKERLDKVSSIMNVTLTGEKCDAIAGHVKEAEKLIGDVKDNRVLDAALIAAAQKVEHYEISAYGTLATFARDLGLKDVEKLLQETLEEEKSTDKKLTELAESRINKKAEETARI